VSDTILALRNATKLYIGVAAIENVSRRAASMLAPVGRFEYGSL
jgi:hypothetical protein